MQNITVLVAHLIQKGYVSYAYAPINIKPHYPPPGRTWEI